jgi:hypothetical protein
MRIDFQMSKRKTIQSALAGFVLAFLFSSFAARAEPNYDESKVGTFTLPDPLTMNNGAPVLTASDWTSLRRPEILKLYESFIYGAGPQWRNMIDHMRENDNRALGGKALRKQIDLEFYNYSNRIDNDPTNDLKLHLLLYTPADLRKPVPVFLCLSFTGNYADIDDKSVLVYPVWDSKTDTLAVPSKVERGTSHNWKIEEALARGYGVAILNYNDIEPDLADGTGWKYGVRSLYLKQGETNTDGNAWGAIAAWAWGASRVMDYLETDKNVDARHVILFGHSRLGKAALWAGAEDQRFAMVIASCSGEMGASLSRRDYGETVTTMCQTFPYWFCPNFLDYNNNLSAMPVDSHMLISLIAPRPLFLSTGSEDRWGDPRGEWEAAIAAAPVYKLLGEQGVVTNLPPDVMTDGNGTGSLLKSDVLESYPMPPLDVPVMRDVGFQTHTGKHDVLPEDWERFLDFADLHFFGKTPHEYKASAQNQTTSMTETNEVKTGQ